MFLQLFKRKRDEEESKENLSLCWKREKLLEENVCSLELFIVSENDSHSFNCYVERVQGIRRDGMILNEMEI